MVHAGQHDRVPEQVTADGAGQILSQAALGGRTSTQSRSHGDGSEEMKVKAWRKRERGGDEHSLPFAETVNQVAYYTAESAAINQIHCQALIQQFLPVVHRVNL